MSQDLYSLKTITLPTLAALAMDVGLNQRQFFRDLLDDRFCNFVKANCVAGINLGVNRTPTLFVGGQQFHGKLTMARLLPVVQQRCKAVLGSVDRKSGLINW